MISNYKKLILDLSLGEISKDQFLNLFPDNLALNKNLIQDYLEVAFIQKKPDDVELILLLGFNFGFPEECVNVLCKLVLADWHNQHENIALVLKDLKSPESVDCLFQAALINFPYLDFDESHAFGVKCIYALRAIATDNAKEKLVLLTQAKNKIIAENAARLLKAMEV